MTVPKQVFVGIDVAKLRNAVAVAEAGRDGEIRYMGEFDATPESMTRLIRKLAAKHGKLHVCYEAGPTGYGLYRQILALGHECWLRQLGPTATRPVSGSIISDGRKTFPNLYATLPGRRRHGCVRGSGACSPKANAIPLRSSRSRGKSPPFSGLLPALSSRVHCQAWLHDQEVVVLHLQ